MQRCLHAISSDYSGFHQGAAFEVRSFVITNLESLSLWEQNRMHLRKRYLPEGRRMSYKALNDGRRSAALLPFLEAANQIPGLLLSIAIDKNLPTIFCSELAHSHPLLDGWKPAPIERAMRTMHFASLLLRGLSSAGQDLWVRRQHPKPATPDAHHRRTVGGKAANYFTSISRIMRRRGDRAREPGLDQTLLGPLSNGRPLIISWRLEATGHEEKISS